MMVYVVTAEYRSSSQGKKWVPMVPEVFSTYADALWSFDWHKGYNAPKPFYRNVMLHAAEIDAEKTK